MNLDVLLVGWLVVGLFFVSLLNGLMFVVLIKNLHWLWIRKREDQIDQCDYIVQKIREG